MPPRGVPPGPTATGPTGASITTGECRKLQFGIGSRGSKLSCIGVYGDARPRCHKAMDSRLLSASVLLRLLTLKKEMLTLLFREEHIACRAVSELFLLITKRDLKIVPG